MLIKIDKNICDNCNEVVINPLMISSIKKHDYQETVYRCYYYIYIGFNNSDHNITLRYNDEKERNHYYEYLVKETDSALERLLR